MVNKWPTHVIKIKNKIYKKCCLTKNYQHKQTIHKKFKVYRNLITSLTSKKQIKLLPKSIC